MQVGTYTCTYARTPVHCRICTSWCVPPIGYLFLDQREMSSFYVGLDVFCLFNPDSYELDMQKYWKCII
jgi:hypothetical protein